MKRLCATLVSTVLLSFLTILLLPRAAWADDLVKDVRGEVQELRDDGSHTSYRVLFTPASGLALAALEARVKRVLSGHFVDDGLVPAFTPRIDPDPKTGPALVIEVNFNVLSRPGTYDVEIGIVRNDKAGAPGQRLTVQLTRPAAQLRAPASLLFDVTVHLFGSDTIEPSQFTLAEASERSAIDALNLQQIERATHGNEEISGRLSFGAPQRIAARGTLEVTAVPEGNFPIGASKGRIEARASALSSPAMFSYELRRRLPSFWVPVIVLVSGLLGWFFRIYLKHREERLSLEVKIDDLLAEFDRLGKGWMEKGQKGELTLLREEIQRARSSRDAADLGAAVKKAEALIAAVTAARGKQQQALINDVGQAIAVLDQRWTLPAGIALDKSKKLFADAEGRAIAGDLEEAEDLRRKAAEAVVELLVDGEGWARSINDEIKALVSFEAGLLASAAEALKNGAGAVNEVLAKLKDMDPVKPPLEDLLRVLHRAEGAAAELAGQIGDALAVTAKQVAAVLDSVKGKDEQARAALAEDAAQVRAAVQVDGSGDALATLTRVSGASRDLFKAIDGAVRGLPARMGPNDSIPVADLLKQGQYAKALKMVEAKAEDRPMIIAFSGEGLEGVPSPEEVAVRAPRVAAEPPPVGAREVVLRGEVRAPLQIPHLTPLKKLLIAKVARGIFAAGVMAFGARVFYADDFYGTWRELAGLFALGFSSDFTVEGALSLFNKPGRG